MHLGTLGYRASIGHITQYNFYIARNFSSILCPPPRANSILHVPSSSHLAHAHVIGPPTRCCIEKTTVDVTWNQRPCVDRRLTPAVLCLGWLQGFECKMVVELQRVC
jgi:hypothetical protein